MADKDIPVSGRLPDGTGPAGFAPNPQAVSVLPDASPSRDAFAAAAMRRPQVFLDCDGVLADFDKAGDILFGMSPRDAERIHGSKQFWHRLEHELDFYGTLPLMPDALDLYEGVRHLNPIILTGCPRGTWAQGQKVAWAARHFPGVPIITCRSADKRVHAKPGDVLIDDWPQHRHRWIEMGGVFISHYDAATSLEALWAHYPALRDRDAAQRKAAGFEAEGQQPGPEGDRP